VMKNQKKAYLLALSAIFLWSTVASAFKFSLRYLEPVELLLYSSWVSCMIFLFVLLVQGKLRLLLPLRGIGLGASALLGFLNPFLYYLVLFKSYALLPAQEAQPLNYTWPIVLVLFSALFLKQRIRGGVIAAMMVSFAGVLVISSRGSLQVLQFGNRLGVLLAVGSSFIWTVFWILNMKDSRDPALKLFLSFIWGAVYVTAYYAAFFPMRIPPAAGLLGSAYVGAFEMGLTFILWLSALQKSTSTARISNLVFLSPFVSLIFIHFFLGEEIYISTVIGLFLIVGGILLQQIQPSATREEAAP
jgi:drug/metabolite transporter (DMT)-like permease